MSPGERDQEDRLWVGISQILTASILVHQDGCPQFIQYDPVLKMWSIMDQVHDPRRPAYEVNQQDLIVHLPK